MKFIWFYMHTRTSHVALVRVHLWCFIKQREFCCYLLRSSVLYIISHANFFFVFLHVCLSFIIFIMLLIFLSLVVYFDYVGSAVGFGSGCLLFISWIL